MTFCQNQSAMAYGFLRMTRPTNRGELRNKPRCRGGDAAELNAIRMALHRANSALKPPIE